MNRGLYTASVGMITQMNKMDVVSNNIANVDTTGYKKDAVITRSFDEEMYLRVNEENSLNIVPRGQSIGTLNLGNNVDVIQTKFINGSLERTESQTDLAINGDGFFSVNYVSPDGSITEKYTRDGSFSLGPNGELLTAGGYAVLDENGAPIVIPNSTVPTVNEDGTIYANGEYLTRLKLTSFEDNSYLKKFGENFYDAVDGATPVAFTGQIEQGFVEMSNVNSVEEMVEMINLSRAYEASSKVITTYDSIMQKEANEVGRK